MNTDPEFSIKDILCSVTIGILVIYAIYWFMNDWDFRKKLPPGPFRFPLVGTLLFHGFSPEALSELSDKHGDIYTIYVGNNRVVVMNSLEFIKEAFVTKAHSFSGRDHGWISSTLNPTQTGVAYSEYTAKLRHTKNIALAILRNIGYGKSVMDQKIQQELDSLVGNIMESKQQAFDPINIMLMAKSNILFNLICGEKHGYHDDTALQITNAVANFFKADAMIVELFSFTRFIPKFAREVKKMIYEHDIIMGLIRAKVGEHLDNHTEGNDSNLIHAYIDKHKNPQTKAIDLDMENLVYLIRDIFMGGVETSTSSMMWLVLLLANHPEAQQKAYAEIERVVGKDKDISKDDKENLSYIEAVIWEAQRFKTITPFAVPHCAEQGDTIAGYTIPRGTTLIANVSHVHMNPLIWGDPLMFKPERSLDICGKFTRHAHVIPFSIGKRQCLGDVLARQTLFLFTATLIRKFYLSPPEGVDRIDEEGHLGFTYSPKPFTVRAIAREAND